MYLITPVTAPLKLLRSVFLLDFRLLSTKENDFALQTGFSKCRDLKSMNYVWSAPVSEGALKFVVS